MRGLALLLLASFARGATIFGTDYGGAALVPNNGDVLSGTFTNVSLFQIDAGKTVFVTPAIQLTVYASTVSIAGVLDASGRGQPGGGGGAPSGAGQPGFDAADPGTGGGAAAAGKGGGGGAAGGAGGVGSGTGGGAAGGPAYGSTGTVTIPLSSDDALMGSGGGGGGGTGTTGGSGAAGGGAVYLEASSMTLTGAILANGATAAATTSAAATPPGAGGGGGGGTILLRVKGPLFSVAGSTLSANGGPGGAVASTFGGTYQPGGGGGGGRIKVFSAGGGPYVLAIATAAGVAGGRPLGGGADAAPPAGGTTGSASFGVVASSPTAFAAQSVYVTSINWTWAAAPSFGDGPTLSRYRVYRATATAPLTAPESDTSSSVVGATVTALSPNTTYYRFVTAYTDWGDSQPSNGATAYTLADAPGSAAAAFPSVTEAGLSFAWTSGAQANPSYTQYEVSRSSLPGFGLCVSTSLVVGLSSTTSGLLPNTSYYLRARALNLAGIPTQFTTTATTATLAAVPASAAFGPVFVTSMSVTWNSAGNPPDTQYLVEASSNNFASVSKSSVTALTISTFTALEPGVQYYFRVSAFNRHALQSAYSSVISVTGGNVSDMTSPSIPGSPVADRQFSYDGTVLFAWTPASHAAGILYYHLIVGSLPGASDRFDGNIAVASQALSGLPSGRSYYAQVRSRANNGVYSAFSGSSAGLPVFDTTVAAAITKPFAWPNPFDPRTGPAQIGFSMPEPGSVVTRIFTLQGRQVYEQTQDFGAGNQVLSWSGQNGSGTRVAPGGYIIMIQKRLSGRVETQKMKMAVLY